MQKDKTQSRLKDLENLVLSQQDRLFALAYIRIGNRADAEDILQDVFLKLFRSEENLRHVNRLEHYLSKKQYNLLPSDAAARVAIPEEDNAIHEEYLRISKLLDGLSEEQQEVVRLKCTDGLKLREIAKILDIPEATAKSRYRYAIEHIQNILNI